MRDYQHIGCAVNRIGRGVERGVGRDLKLGHLVCRQIPRDCPAGDGEAGGIEIVGGSIFLRRVDHGHTGAYGGRASADGHIACKRGR